MFVVPTDQRKLVSFANDMIEACRSSAGVRTNFCRVINSICETGQSDGTRSIINMMWSHIRRTSSMIFSPTGLKFSMGFERKYPEEYYTRAAVVAEQITNEWDRSNIDLRFSQGVFESTKYGAAILKQWVQEEGAGDKAHPVYYNRLVMPWQFGVYREDENDLSKQHAMCETANLTMPEVWRRIYHLPDAKKLFDRISANSDKGMAASDTNSFFHQVLSTSVLNTTGVSAATRPVPGGIVQMNQDPNYTLLMAQMDIPLVRMHELWVRDESIDDWCTIQVIEPDIIIAPLMKKSNLLIPGSGLTPYTLIQSNPVNGYFWGRSELTDLIEPQGFISETAVDIRRLFGLQVDKVIGFAGDDISDERYDQMRAAGYYNIGSGGSISDLTPKFPEQAMPLLKAMMDIFNLLGGFPDVLQGKGEPGVRAGSHAGTLVKTGSPMLRERSLIVERQCAQAADLTLDIKTAKDASNYWTDATSIETIDKTSFFLSDLPDDRRIEVDSHSGSPIFQDDHAQLISFGIKAGFVDPEYAVDNLNFPNKESLKQKIKKKQAQQAQMMKEHPELLEKMMTKGRGGGHK